MRKLTSIFTLLVTITLLQSCGSTKPNSFVKESDGGTWSSIFIREDFKSQIFTNTTLKKYRRRCIFKKTLSDKDLYKTIVAHRDKLSFNELSARTFVSPRLHKVADTLLAMSGDSLARQIQNIDKKEVKQINK